jgi:hypothetical protein
VGRFPTPAEVQLKRQNDPTFPCQDVFQRRWTKSVLVERLLAHCRSREGYNDVACLCEEYLSRSPAASEDRTKDEVEIGFVYLIKSGRFFKIGKSNSAGRREYELAIQLPEKAKTIHTIRTDDPSGIEAYWHKRFEAKRKNGEWFDLNAMDVAAFKRRKFM